MKKLLYIDLFAGCGGLSLWLYNSGLWQGVLAVEKNAMAFETLRYNLIEKMSHFDWPAQIPCAAHEIDEFLTQYRSFLESLEWKIDLIAGGPPCQGFSTAWKRQEGDGRNHLVHSYIEFVSIVKPKIIFFENVKGFTLEFKKNKDKGKNFSSEVIKSLEEIGYDVHGEMMDFSKYWVPQTRKRFILVGVRSDVSESLHVKAEKFHKLINILSWDILDKKGLKRLSTLSEAISDLERAYWEVPSPDSKGFKHGLYGKKGSQLQKTLRWSTRSKTPDSHRFAKHGQSTMARFLKLIEARKRKETASDSDLTKKRNQVVLDEKRPSPTLTTLPDDYIHYSEPRILTVREYARIQTFNDWFEIRGKYTTWWKLRTKEVPRYTQIGNAIPPLFWEQSGIVLHELVFHK
jgi:DNA (cytosine-5)-methyltransferase 1